MVYEWMINEEIYFSKWKSIMKDKKYQEKTAKKYFEF